MRERLCAVAVLGGLTLFNAWLIAELLGLAVSDFVQARRVR